MFVVEPEADTNQLSERKVAVAAGREGTPIGGQRHAVPVGGPTNRDPWLRTIAGFKVAKGTFLLAAAIAALGLIDPRTAHPISRWATEVAADHHYEVANTLVAGILRVEPRTLKMLSVGSFLYSVLFYTEGFGLFLDRRWAKYMTILTTGVLIPFELFELVRRASGAKLGLLAANVAIVAYLIWRLRDETAANERSA